MSDAGAEQEPADLPPEALEALAARDAPTDPLGPPLRLSISDRARLKELVARQSVMGQGYWGLCDADRFSLCRVRLKLYNDVGHLGKGSNALVKVAEFLPTGERRAHKVVPKPPGPAAAVAVSRVRVQGLAIRPAADACPQMVYFFELLDDRNHFHIFTELCEGDMHRYIETHAPLDERTSARVVTLLLRTLATLHAQGIVHRDVKGQNIFLRDMKDPLSIALGDLHSCAVLPPDSASSQPFGPAAGLPDDKSSVFSRDAALQTATGTPLCLSPEVVRGKPYGPKVDVWAAGILLFQLFCRRTPFEDSANYADLYRRIAAADYVVPPLSFPPGAADLLSRLLEPDPSRRPTAAEALRHPWLVATAGDFEPPPRLAGMDAGVAAARGAPPESAGEGSDAGEEDTTGSTLVHPLMMSGAQVDFNFETGSLRVAHPPAKP